MLLGDGDGFVRCACGHWHWGTHGAAGLLVHDPDRGVLLQRRAWWVHHGHTWALPGGAVRSDETPVQAAIREAGEEADVSADFLRPVAQSTEEHHTWRYTTVLATTRAHLRARAVSSESAELRWVDSRRVDRFPLHRDFAAAWPELAEQLDREVLLVVDTATVPWERARVLDRTPLPADELGVPSPAAGARNWDWWPRTVRADGETAVLAAVRDVWATNPRDHVAVITTDPELRKRAATEGAATPAQAALVRDLG